MAENFFMNIEDTNSCGEAPNKALMKILKGDTGNGIASITQTSISEDELEKTYTITYTDGNEFEYIVKDGNSILSIEYIGISEDGLQETYQVNYQDGTTFQYVVNQGVGIKTITKTSTTLLTDTYTITFADNSTTTFDVKNGNGIESIAKTNTNVLVDTYTITFTDTTTTTFDVTNAKSITNIEFVSSDLLTDTYKINFNDNTNITFEVANGRGINNVSYISTNGLVDTYRITYNDNTTSDFIVTNGQGYIEKGLWDGITTYNPYDVVYSDNGVFASKTTNTNSEPTISNTTNWDCWVDISAILGQQKVLIKAQGNIAKGDCLQYVSSLGDRLICKKAVGSEIKVQSKLFMGIASEDILDNQSGYLQTFGLLRNINTSIYNLGDVLYFDYATSTLTPTRPTDESAYLINVLAVTNVSIGNGSVFVRPTWENIVDSVFSKTSTNPIRNSILTNAINSLNLTASIPLSVGQYYTLTTAIAAVPSALRKIGFEITFESSAGVWETYQFKGVIANWSVLGSWSNDLSLKIDKTAVSLYNITNEIPLPAGSYYTLATAIAAIPTNIRKLGLKITFQVSATNTETWEFFNGTIGNITNVAYWRKTANSNDLDLKIDKSSIVQDLGNDETKVMSQKAVTKNISQILQLEGEELWAYGVRWTQGQSSATLERIGNMNMHKTLPCHKTRGCLVLDDGTINYYLHDSTDFLKEDGVTPSILDGTDGDVMNQRKFYYRTAIKDNVHVNWMSPYPLPGYALYENLTGRYKASINRTTGKIHSVINNSPQFRGGGNTSAWDSDGRSLLGCAVTSISRVTLRSGARIDRAVECNGTPEHDDFFVRLIYARVKWATHNFQLPFNPELDANGYHQGGFGAGTTNLSSTKWSGYNGYNPFIPCGYTAEFGNGSGVKDFVMPFEYDGYNTTLSQQKYIGVYDSGRVYATGEYVSESLDTYKGSGDALLYLCILDAPAGTSLTNTTYFSLVNRTVTQAIRMDGEEQWFGEVWEHYANVIIEHNADVEPKTSKAYIFNNPSQIAETRTGNEEFLCDLPISDGYIKEFNADSIFPISTGGGSITYGCDYYSCNYPASGIATRGCLGGGYAYYGSTAGPSCSLSRISPSISAAYIGGRLVRKSKNIVIIDD